MNATMAVCALFLVATLGGCSSLRSPTFPSPETRKGVHVKVDGLYRAGMGVVLGLSGTATNNTGRDLRGCGLGFSILNGQGEKVGDAVAFTQSLRAGQVWRYQAVFSVPFATTFERVELAEVTLHQAVPAD